MLGESLSLPGLNINWPFSQLILAGVKTIETRKYALGHMNIAQPDLEMWLVETRAQEDALAKGGVLAGGAAVAPRPEELRADREIVLEVVKQSGNALQYAAVELRSDRAFALEAVSQNGRALQYTAWEL